jgi:hypothetical protein
MFHLIAPMMWSTYGVSYTHLQGCNKSAIYLSGKLFIISKEPYIEKEYSMMKEVNDRSRLFLKNETCFYEG